VSDKDERYYQVVLIWMRDPAKFRDYLETLGPIVTRYSGAADISIEPTEIWADDLTLPQIVNLVHYDSKEAFERFNADPDFAAIVHLRDESVDLCAFGGWLVTADRSTSGLAERLYHIELVRFPDGSPAAYRRYEAEGESVMRRYGFQVEYVVELEPQPGQAPQPQLAKISCFPNKRTSAEFHNDPAHKQIETQLYPAAVSEPIWITGRAVRRGSRAD
jgi:uncharacterized protein (DUF1330 family)